MTDDSDPAAGDYFDEILGRLDRPERLETARREGRKTVAVVGVHVPEALFRACGAAPIWLGGLVEPIERDGDLPRDACALCRTTFDLLADRWIPAGLIDAVVVASGCDWTARLVDRLSGAGAPVWPLNVARLPRSGNEMLVVPPSGGVFEASSPADRLSGAAVPVWPLNVARLPQSGNEMLVVPPSGGVFEASSPAEAGTTNNTPNHPDLSDRASQGGREGLAALQARVGSLEAMLRELEILTDLPLTKRAFREALDRAAALEALCERLDRLRAASPPRISAGEYYRIAGARDLADPDRWATEVETFLARRETDPQQENRDTRSPTADPQPSPQSNIHNPQSKMKRPRIVLAGCPTGFPDVSIVALIEEAGLRVVGESFSGHGRGALRRARPRGGRKAILRWAAEALSVSGDPGPDGRESPVASLAADRKADGVIWLHYRGCAVSAMDLSEEMPRLAARDCPLLAVEIDQIGFGTEALQTRLEAFRERLG